MHLSSSSWAIGLSTSWASSWCAAHGQEQCEHLHIPTSRVPSELLEGMCGDCLGLRGMIRSFVKRVTACCEMFFSILNFCLANGIPGYLENPKTSIMFIIPKFKSLQKQGLIHFTDCHFCQCGTQRKKATTFVSWLWKPALAACQACQGRCSKTGQKHVQLSGIQSKRFMTSFAQT